MPAVFSSMNFNPCFEVDGSQTFSVLLDVNDTRQADVIVVYETYDTLVENALWQVRLDTARRIGQTTRRILNDNGQITYDSANRLKPVINYLSQSWRAPELCTPTLSLCTADSLSLHGRIAEVLYFDRRIPDTAVIQWISYLAVKYGVTLFETDYLDSRCRVIWDYTNHPEYRTAIAGVGRDDSVGLYQRQTYYADGQMVFGIGQYAETKEGNSTAIADGDFILLGMAGDLQTSSELYAQNGDTYEVVGRSLAQVTDGAHAYGTFLFLDSAAVPDSVAPVLLIDRSGTGEFPTGETDFVTCAGTDSAGRYCYYDIHWDTDLNGLDFFCFTVQMPDTTGTPKALAMNEDGDMVMGGDDLENGTRRDVTRNVSTTDPKNAKTASSIPQYRLLPNPNHGRFVVETEYPEAQDVTVTIYDADGRLLLTMDGKGECRYRFEGTVQTAGHYLIDIYSPMERKTLKMVVN